MRYKILLISLVIFLTINCTQSGTRDKKKSVNKDNNTQKVSSYYHNKNSIVFNQEYIANKFDFPVGKPDGKGYYNAQKFMENNYLGDDWNSVTGGNSDLGDPIYSIGNGYVKFAKNIGGDWGKVIRINHKLKNGEIIESLYAHCDSIFVKEGDWVKIGDKISTIGDVNGLYYAHLHLEIRENINLPIGHGYSRNNKGYLDPTKFIQTNRKILK